MLASSVTLLAAVACAACEHTFRVESGEARLLVLLTPSGLDGLDAELGGPTDPHGGKTDAPSRDMGWLVTASARYGVEITRPPPAGMGTK